jgi:hypothetical protein
MLSFQVSGQVEIHQARQAGLNLLLASLHRFHVLRGAEASQGFFPPVGWQVERHQVLGNLGFNVQGSHHSLVALPGMLDAGLVLVVAVSASCLSAHQTTASLAAEQARQQVEVGHVIDSRSRMAAHQGPYLLAPVEGLLID